MKQPQVLLNGEWVNIPVLSSSKNYYTLKDRAFNNNRKSVRSSFSFNSKYSQSISMALADASTALKAQVIDTDNGSLFFAGEISPALSDGFNQFGASGFRIEIWDNSSRLDERINEEVFFPSQIGERGESIFLLSDPENSIITKLILLAGYSISDIDSNSVELPDTIDFFSVTAEDGKTYRNVIDNLLFEHRCYIKPTLTGKFRIAHWELDVIIPNHIIDKNIGIISGIKRKKTEFSNYDSSQVVWSTLKILEDVRLFRENLPIDTKSSTDNPHFPWSGQPIMGGDYYPSDSDIKEIYQTYQKSWLDIPYLNRKTRITNDDLDLIAADHVYMMYEADSGIVVDLSIIGKKNAQIRFLNATGDTKNIYYWMLYGNALIRNSIEETTSPSAGKNPNIYTSSYIYNPKAAAKLSDALETIRLTGIWTYTFSVRDLDIFPGEILQIVKPDWGMDQFVMVQETQKTGDDGLYTISAVGIRPFHANTTTQKSHISTTADSNLTQNELANTPTYKELLKGFENGFGTKVPVPPILMINMSGRNANLLCSIQENLTAPYTWDFQVSQDQVYWYPLCYNSSDWRQGTAGEYTSGVVIPATTQTHIPNVEDEDGIISGRTLYWRCRIHLDDETLAPYVSEWSNIVTGTTTPIKYDDLGPSVVGEANIQQNSISENLIQDDAVSASKVQADVLNSLIAQLNSYLLISEVGFSGANFNQSNDGHIYTTADRRAYMDQDEILFQEVAAVDPENLPTWRDAIKIGGEFWDIEVFQSGSKFGYDLYGPSEHYFSPYELNLTSSIFALPYSAGLVIASDGCVAFKETDNDNVIGYFDLNAAAFSWGGSLSVFGDLSAVGRANLSEILLDKGFGVGTTSSINTEKLAYRSIQIATDTYFGGVYNNHTGYLIYATMPGGWGSAQLHFAVGTNWREYDTAGPAMTLTDTSLLLNGKTAFKAFDSWLRINENGEFSNGVYYGNTNVRTDGAFIVGNNGQYHKFYNNGYAFHSGQLTVGGLIYTNDHLTVFNSQSSIAADLYSSSLVFSDGYGINLEILTYINAVHFSLKGNSPLVIDKKTKGKGIMGGWKLFWDVPTHNSQYVTFSQCNHVPIIGDKYMIEIWSEATIGWYSTTGRCNSLSFPSLFSYGVQSDMRIDPLASRFDTQKNTAYIRKIYLWIS